MPDSSPERGARVGLLFSVIGLVITLLTFAYAIVNKKDFLYIDSTGMPAGPIGFLFFCGPPLLLAWILCIVGIVYGWGGLRRFTNPEQASERRKARAAIWIGFLPFLITVGGCVWGFFSLP